MAKFNPKDLSYDQNLPPFLAALRGQLQGDDRGPDPIIAGRRRAVKKRSASEEAEDAPLVVDERGVVVGGVTVGKDGAVQDEAVAESSSAATDGAAAAAQDRPDEDAQVAFGAGKKRRVGKIVGGDEYAAAARDVKRKRDGKADNEASNAASKDEETKPAKKDKKDKDKNKKDKKDKRKKIQLSFEDEEEG